MSLSQSTGWGEVEMAGDWQTILSNNKHLSPPEPPSFRRVHLLFPGQLETLKVRSLQGCKTWFSWFFCPSPSTVLRFLWRQLGGSKQRGLGVSNQLPDTTTKMGFAQTCVFIHRASLYFMVHSGCFIVLELWKDWPAVVYVWGHAILLFQSIQ